MRDAKCLAKDVRLPDLAVETKNFSGAEIEGLVKAAASFAFNRHVTAEAGGVKIGKVDDMELEMADFERALGEVRASGWWHVVAAWRLHGGYDAHSPPVAPVARVARSPTDRHPSLPPARDR